MNGQNRKAHPCIAPVAVCAAAKCGGASARDDETGLRLTYGVDPDAAGKG